MSAPAACGPTACGERRPSVAHVGVDARVATVVALAAGFAMRMLAVRYGWEMRTFGAADVEH
ncbi:hypothetical protein WK80_08055 [Burkholderia multivorans]|uniref:hypothetical protein n=1 Tax=Burkholderia multivorans TaxID=87883 RepID=UPI00075EF201|nr:hypothetical protein [Burkholderia multivorans]KVV32157.1 hypothetical protein WK80_08055 [Burkholderia multivorans]MBU9200801.1 hypothetical protein [Burkholderia multivorans]MCA8385689.1 hypothetical protein [Burkholderia multivorans]MCO8317888.1 hypothetical protein [Burkholderia multivorans]MCO8350813.1 hypothetical protein [Burkholderia multivorans]